MPLSERDLENMSRLSSAANRLRLVVKDGSDKLQIREVLDSVHKLENMWAQLSSEQAEQGPTT